jgi:hypothetical protein
MQGPETIPGRDKILVVNCSNGPKVNFFVALVKLGYMLEYPVYLVVLAR